jgi:hypothetical protein
VLVNVVLITFGFANKAAECEGTWRMMLMMMVMVVVMMWQLKVLHV